MSDPVFGPYAFTLTKDEFLAYARQVAARQLVELDAKSWRLAGLGFFTVVFVLGILSAVGSVDRATLATGALASAGAILMGRFMIRRQIVRSQNMAIDALAKEGDYAQAVSMTIDAEGLLFERAGHADRRPFPELRQVQRLAGLIVFWSGVNDGVALPERVLTGTDDAGRIVETVTARIAPRHA